MATLDELRATHLATVASLQRLMAGDDLSAAERLEASDFLASLALILPHDVMTSYRIEDGKRSARLREGRDASQFGDAPEKRVEAHDAALARFATKPAPAPAPLPSEPTPAPAPAAPPPPAPAPAKAAAPQPAAAAAAA